MTRSLNLCREVYEAAARNGFLQPCQWQPSSSVFTKTAWVSLQTSDQSVLHQLALSAETTMSYPAGALAGLKQGEVVKVGGARYQVRDVRTLRDGSEMLAKLTQLPED